MTIEIAVNQSRFGQLRQELQDIDGVTYDEQTKEIKIDKNKLSESDLEKVNSIFSKYNLTPPNFSNANNVVSVKLEKSLEEISKNASVDIFVIMALFHELTVTGRKENRNMRDEALNLRMEKLQEVANEMRTAANFRFAAGLTQAVGKMASGAANVAGGMAGFGRDGQAAMAIGRGSGEALQGASDGIAAGLNFQADQADIRKTEAQKEAERKQSDYEKAREQIQANNETIQSIRKSLAELEQSKNESVKSIFKV